MCIFDRPDSNCKNMPSLSGLLSAVLVGQLSMMLAPRFMARDEYGY